MCKQRFYVLGMTDDQDCSFSSEASEVIRKGKVFSGGKRHHEIVASFLPEDAEWIDITVPLDAVFARYEAHSEVIVFASGDPLFFGFANTIRKRLPDAEVKVYPAFNSLQMLAHRMLLPYQDMRMLSLTGRPWHDFDASLIAGERLMGVLTDRQKTPSVIAERMLAYGYDNYRMTVGVNLGNREKESVHTYSLQEVVGKEFGFPNCLILEQTSMRKRPFGIPETAFHLLDGRAKMITKMPIRLLSLSMLDLHNKRSLWDVGFCTGSVSIEAKLQFPHLDVTAFERREEGEELMKLNAQKFGTPGIVTCIGDFEQVDVSTFPVPDSVFIGGHGGRLKEMLQKISQVLQPGGCIVFNSVSEQSLRLFIEGIEEIGMRIVEQHRVVIDKFNPIEIIKAE